MPDEYIFELGISYLVAKDWAVTLPCFLIVTGLYCYALLLSSSLILTDSFESISQIVG